MPGPVLVTSAQLTCAEGTTPSVLNVLPTARVLACGRPVAAIKDHQALVDIPTFGMCHSLTNPEVASATSAAEGVLTPMPCVPALIAPWTPGGPTVFVGGQPVAAVSSTLLCVYAGEITVTQPGQETVVVG